MKTKLLFLAAAVALAGCNSASEDRPELVPGQKQYIVSGQSNATGCDWSYFESITDSQVTLIARSGHSIDQLIDVYNPLGVLTVDAEAIIFVHGESDAIAHTPPEYYRARVEEYRAMISNDVGVNLPLLVSTVGYYDKSPDEDFDIIRNAAKAEAAVNPNWVIAYDDAQYFRDWGYLTDGVHFSEDGCIAVMEGIAGAL